VLYEADGAVAVVTLNRPEVLNALTPELLGSLRQAAARAASEGKRALLLTGAGRGFSAGQDLASIQDGYTATSSPDLGGLLRETYHPLLAELRALPMPVITAVNGVAAGAGLALALAGDIRLAAENARFATAFTKIGLVPDAGLAYILPRLVGAGRASSLLITGDTVDAQTALAWGMVDRVFPAESFAADARAFAATVAAGPTRAYVLTRELLDRAWELPYSALLGLEAELQQRAGDTADHRGAIAAFLEKRPAAFEGR
jgi:2-(1,2-epoxy-1,2-dihydrophenyl)acetyl-CoA isomerase